MTYSVYIKRKGGFVNPEIMTEEFHNVTNAFYSEGFAMLLWGDEAAPVRVLTINTEIILTMEIVKE